MSQTAPTFDETLNLLGELHAREVAEGKAREDALDAEKDRLRDEVVPELRRENAALTAEVERLGKQLAAL